MEKLTKQMVFRDPIYGYIHIDYKFIKDLIDTSAFQRLRRIKQLSGVNMVFHCAEHSRFTHSLGTYEVANHFLNSKLKNSLTEYEQKVFLGAALLHDIGHGPYSHAFENVFKTNHEQIGARIILTNLDIRNILNKVSDNFADDIASIILKSHKFPLIENLISSQLDCDRLDYLARDAYYTGTPYGSIDVERIIRVTRIIDDKICFKESGAPAIENYLIARYHMYWQVYYHPKSRSFEVILEKFYQRIKDLFDLGYSFNTNIHYLLNVLNNIHDLDSYMLLDDTYINSLIAFFANESNDLILKTLSQDFINRNLWNTLKVDEENLQSIKEISKKYLDSVFSDYFYSENSVAQNTYNSNEDSISDEISILLENGTIKPLKDFSSVINSLVSSIPKTDLRFFYRKDLPLNEK